MKITLLLALALVSSIAAAPPGGSIGIAAQPSGDPAFLHIDANGALLLAGSGPNIGTDPGGNVGVALDPNGIISFLHVDANGGLIVSGGGSGVGTVTSVAFAMPSSVFNVSGTPVTTAGTLTGTFKAQTANTFFRGPNSGSAAVPNFGVLVSADIPPINLASSGNGGVTNRIPLRVISVAYAATVTPDADVTDALNVGALTGNVTVASPSGTPTDWQLIKISLSASGADRQVTFGAKYQIPTSSSVTNPLTITSGTESVFAFMYRLSTDKWRMVSNVPGY